jgi:hypothetical protein
MASRRFDQGRCWRPPAQEPHPKEEARKVTGGFMTVEEARREATELEGKVTELRIQQARLDALRRFITLDEQLSAPESSEGGRGATDGR